MEPKFQSSFIPKKPVVSMQNTALPVIRETNIFSLIATVSFIVVIMVGGALFAYQKVLESQITEAATAVEEARASFQADKIQDLIISNSKILSAKELLVQHVAVSKLLLLMQELTVAKIKFGDFLYSDRAGAPTLKIDTEAQSYNALAVQSDIFSQNEFIKTPYFSGFEPQEAGTIRAKFNSEIDTSLVSYTEAINSLSLHTSQ